MKSVKIQSVHTHVDSIHFESAQILTPLEERAGSMHGPTLSKTIGKTYHIVCILRLVSCEHSTVIDPARGNEDHLTILINIITSYKD